MFNVKMSGVNVSPRLLFGIHHLFVCLQKCFIPWVLQG